jgi:lipid-binding SYLF domain-containing protein
LKNYINTVRIDKMKAFKLNKTILFAAMAAFIFFSVQVLAADTMTDRQKAEKIVRDATLILHKTNESTFENAVGIAVFPDRMDMERVDGDGHSLGVLVVRQKNDEWGLPLFVNLSEGSPKDQFGEESSNLVLAFHHRKVLRDLKKGRNANIFAIKGVSSIFPSPGYASGRNTMKISKNLIAAYYNQSGEMEGVTGTMKEIPKSAEMLKYALNSYTSSGR